MRSIIQYTQPRTSSLLPSFGFATPSPWSGLEGEIDRWFGSVLSDYTAPLFENRFPVDLYEDKDHTYVRAELPGVNRDAINVEMVDGYLNLSAARPESAAAGEEPGPTLNLTRSIAIPVEVQADKVTAAYENGVLTVTLPKQEQAKPRKIAISVN